MKRREDDLFFELDDKEQLAYLMFNFRDEDYIDCAMGILNQLFHIKCEQLAMGRPKVMNHEVDFVLCGMIFCADGMVYEFELMRDTLKFRFRVSRDEDYEEVLREYRGKTPKIIPATRGNVKEMVINVHEKDKVN